VDPSLKKTEGGNTVKPIFRGINSSSEGLSARVLEILACVAVSSKSGHRGTSEYPLENTLAAVWPIEDAIISPCSPVYEVIGSHRSEKRRGGEGWRRGQHEQGSPDSLNTYSGYVSRP
jgi:hypothetical protein